VQCLQVRCRFSIGASQRQKNEVACKEIRYVLTRKVTVLLNCVKKLEVVLKLTMGRLKLYRNN